MQIKTTTNDKIKDTVIWTSITNEEEYHESKLPRPLRGNQAL